MSLDCNLAYKVSEEYFYLGITFANSSTRHEEFHYAWLTDKTAHVSYLFMNITRKNHKLGGWGS